MKAQSVLLVDDDPGTIAVMARMLAGEADLRFAVNGADALRVAHETVPDLILLDAEMPGMSGLKVCETLKADQHLSGVPVIFVTSHREPEFELAGFEIGAVDFVAKPISAAMLRARVRTQLRMQRTVEELRRIATLDTLTRVANRNRFDDVLQREWSRCRRSGEPLSLLTIDADHFKRYGDRYGHTASDACLAAIAKALGAACRRPADLVARTGDDEFALLLPHTPRLGALHMAHRVIDTIEALGIEHDGSDVSRHVTVSVGVGNYDEDCPSWKPPSADSRLDDLGQAAATAADLLQTSAAALAWAKLAGRAQVQSIGVGDGGQHYAALAARAAARQDKSPSTP